MSVEPKTVELHGGPWNGETSTSLGEGRTLGLAISREVNGQLDIGTAWYELSEDETMAFWLGNRWVAL